MDEFSVTVSALQKDSKGKEVLEILDQLQVTVVDHQVWSAGELYTVCAVLYTTLHYSTLLYIPLIHCSTQPRSTQLKTFKRVVPASASALTLINSTPSQQHM